MKKSVFGLMTIAAVAFALTSCDKLSEFLGGNTSKEEVNEQGLVDDGGTAIEAEAQKTKIEDTADAVMGAFDLNVWKSNYDKAYAIVETTQEKELDGSVITEKLDAIVDLWMSESGEDPYVVYTTVARLSDLKGHFTENAEGGFDYEEADDLQITIYVDGEAVTFTFSVVEREDKILLYSKDAYYDNETDINGDGVVDENDVVKEYGEDVYFYLPQSAKAQIIAGNEVLASLDVTLNFTDVNANGQVDPDADKLDLSTAITIEPYTLTIEQINYSKSDASVSVKLSNGSQVILALSASASYNLTASENEYAVVPVKASAMLDIMGKLQIRGSIPDYEALIEMEDNIYKAQKAGDKEAYEAAVAEFEKLIGLGVYYDGTSTLQASLGFEPEYYSDGGYDYWYANPVIRFADGTSYGVEEYFTQERFGDLLQKIIEWSGKITAYLGVD